MSPLAANISRMEKLVHAAIFQSKINVSVLRACTAFLLFSCLNPFHWHLAIATTGYNIIYFKFTVNVVDLTSDITIF